MGPSAQRRTLVYVSTLIAAAVLTACSGTLGAGYDARSSPDGAALSLWQLPSQRESAFGSRSLSAASRPLRSSRFTYSHTLSQPCSFGPLAAAVVGAASMLGDPELIARRDRERAPRLKWATYTSTRFIGGAAMGLAAQATLAAVPSEFGGLVAASLVGAVVGELFDVLFAALTAQCPRQSHQRRFGTIVPIVLTSAPVYAPIVALLAFMYVRVSPWTLALFLVPAMAAQRLYGALPGTAPARGRPLHRQRRPSSGQTFSSPPLLIATFDARDRYTAGHSAAVAIYSRDIAGRMGLPAETCEPGIPMRPRPRHWQDRTCRRDC